MNIRGFYNIHTLARQGERGRPAGGVSCLIKPGLAQFRIMLQDEDRLVIKTNCCYIITAYYKPECTAVDIIDSLSQAINVVPAQEKLVLSGDFNCPIDKPTRKTNEVLTFLEGEGIRLINEKSMPTYICYNGTSAIDLTFVRGIIARNHRQLWKSEGELWRKHLPIYTELEQNVKEVVQAGAIRRRLETSILEDTKDHQEEIVKLIGEAKLDKAMEEIASIMKKATGRLKMKKRNNTGLTLSVTKKGRLHLKVLAQ